MMRNSEKFERGMRTGAYLAVLLFICGLGLYAYLGLYNRYFADDYCFNSDVRNLGLVGTLEGYTYITHYASNRYALVLFSGLMYLLGGIRGVILMTPLTILLWFVGLFFFFRKINLLGRLGYPVLLMVLSVAIILYFCIYLAPHQYQSLYWRSGLLPYTTTILGTLWTSNLILEQYARQDESKVLLFLIGPLVFITGGFSEHSAAYLTTALALYTAWALGKSTKGQISARSSLRTVVVGLVFGIFSLIVLAASPANSIRMERAYGGSVNLQAFFAHIFVYSFDFIEYSLESFPLPHSVIFSGFFFLPYLFASAPVDWRQGVKWIAIILAVAYLLIAACYAPSVLFEGGPPRPSTQIITRFTMILAISLVALLAGGLFRQRFDSTPIRLFALVLLLGFFAYSARSMIKEIEKIEISRTRAVIWDQRNDEILRAVERGETEIDVRAIDGLPVGGLLDFKPKGSFWTNSCAAAYYGLDEIRATIP